jgi:hypothetical protein
MLVFPKDIRLAKADEIPPSADNIVLLEKIDGAQIEQGYSMQVSTDSLFSYYAEVNVDASQI